MAWTRRWRQWAAGLTLIACTAAAPAQERHIVMASTTSTEQSGLFKHLLPRFTAASGITVRVVAVGTGQALDIGRRGDADLLLVHDRAAEERFVADGHGLARREVMFNDFVLVGPSGDPARLRGRPVTEALRLLAEGRHGFVSRGDRSGTHAAELRLWKQAGLDPPAGADSGYRACGCGMGPALNMAAATGAHLLSDRGTWLAFRNRAGMAILVEGDPGLRNPYGVMVVNPARHPHVKADLAQAFVDWVTSPAGQQAIADYRIEGERLFFPSAL